MKYTKTSQIPDEVIYEAIRESRRQRDERYREYIPTYDDLSSTAQIMAVSKLLEYKLSGEYDINLEHKDVFDLVDAPVKVTVSKMQKMVDLGKLDYGVSLRTAWIVGEE